MAETENDHPTDAQEPAMNTASTEEHHETEPQSVAEAGSVETLKRKNPEEPGENVANPLWKTSLCSYFRRQSQSCSHGDSCRYAHGEAELRLRPDNSWDPTSERAKTLLKSESGEETEPNPREDVCPPAVCVNASESANTLPFNKCVIHLPMKWNSYNFKSFLDNQGIPYASAKKKKGTTVGFVGFAIAEHVTHATEVLDGKPRGNKYLKIADVISRLREKEPSSGLSLNETSAGNTENSSATEVPNTSGTTENGDNVEKDSCSVDGSILKTRTARDMVTPLAHMPYSDQLEHKKNSVLQTLKRLTRNARKACPDGVPLPDWILKSRDRGGLPCELLGMLESPVINGYRNKCEFSIGYSLLGKRTVGFMLGNFRDGMTAVEEPVDCLNVSRISCKFASIFQEFLQSSVLPVWDRAKNTGFWRQFTVREGRTPSQPAEQQNAEASITEVMLIIQVCSVSVDEELKKKEFERVAQALAHGASTCSPPLPLTVLVVQDHKGISNAAPIDCPLLSLPIPRIETLASLEEPHAAESRIHDYISNLCFSISPTAFFQVNTLAAGKLYALAGDWARLGPNTLLFDICCGTGTIGLILAQRVGMVVGIEMNASAVADAQRNAEINGIKNCRFVCAKAEDVMGSLLREYLNSPQPQDEALPTSASNSEDNISENENCTDNANTLDTDACMSNADSTKNDVTIGNEKNSGILEDTMVPEQQCDGKIENHGNLVDGDKENGTGTLMLDESLKSELDPHDNGRDFRDQSHKNNVLEEKNGTSSPIRQFEDVVAIVDPPRVGLHPVVIKALRTHPGLRRLVYISCNPESLVANAIELCTPSTDRLEKGQKFGRWRNMSSAGLARHRVRKMPASEPFQPIKAVAVDMFPHTVHCEMVMLLER